MSCICTTYHISQLYLYLIKTIHEGNSYYLTIW